MSIELNVYSSRPLLTRETLAHECLSPDLPEELRWEIRFLAPQQDSLDPDQTGPLSEDQIVAGWKASSEYSRRLREAFEKTDRQAIEQLYKSDAFGTVELFVHTPPSEEWSALSEPDALEGFPEELRDAIRNATSWYALETHARRNDTSLELHLHLWRMIGVLTYGIIEDPQEGEVENCDTGDKS